jgi:uncharacterized protein YqeY
MESTRRDAGNLRDRLRRALPAAIKAQDTVAVAALRSALAAIDNAEALGADGVGPQVVDPQVVDPQADHASASGRGSYPEIEIAGTVAGVGAGEVARNPLTAWEIEETIRAEVVEHQIVARIYEGAGHLDQAERLRHEAQLLNAYLNDPEPPAN